MADHGMKMSGDSPFRSAADKASSLGWGMGMHDTETNIVLFKHPPSYKKDISQVTVMHKKFYKDFGDLFSQEY
uniref:Uncharacterized protein n=1 Tax=Panagrolaimus davidi TaxID=227884 RepID=A0A914PIG9_9BILA